MGLKSKSLWSQISYSFHYTMVQYVSEQSAWKPGLKHTKAILILWQYFLLHVIPGGKIKFSTSYITNQGI